MKTAELRTCKQCAQTRPLSEFPLKKNRSGTVTPRHTCIECRKAQEKQWSHQAYLRLRDEAPEKYQDRLAANRKRHREHYETRYKTAKLEYNKTRRPKELPIAHVKVKRALASGALIRPAQCSQCAKEVRVEAHHDDYNKPLEVRWLCRPCHSEAHRIYRAAA